MIPGGSSSSQDHSQNVYGLGPLTRPALPAPGIALEPRETEGCVSLTGHQVMDRPARK